MRVWLFALFVFAVGESAARAALPPGTAESCTWKFEGFFEVRVKTAAESFRCDFDPVRESVHGDWKTNFCHAGNRLVQLQRRNLPGVQGASCRILGVNP